MANGEILFAEPWEGRLFGMAITLTEQGVFEWPVFQAALIEQIRIWEARQDTQAEAYPYFELFGLALQDVLTADGCVTGAELSTTASALAALPHGHDH